jgi:hypothetical protein
VLPALASVQNTNIKFGDPYDWNVLFSWFSVFASLGHVGAYLKRFSQCALHHDSAMGYFTGLRLVQTASDGEHTKTQQFPSYFRTVFLHPDRRFLCQFVQEWGVDYISGSTQRLANEDNGFTQSELDTFIEWGGISFLPKFLHGKLLHEDDSWGEYLLDTLERCVSFSWLWSMYLTIIYVAGFCLWNANAPIFIVLRRVSYRVLFLAGLVWILYLFAVVNVTNTNWARDIKGNLRYSSSVENEKSFVPNSILPATLPTRDDVLVEERFGSPQLAMYNDFVNGHPGNRKLAEEISSSAATFTSFPPTLRPAVVNRVAYSMRHSHARFLKQGLSGDWLVMTEKGAESHIMTSLITEAYPVFKRLRRMLRYLRSGYQYGVMRRTTMAVNHMVPYLQYWDQALLTSFSPGLPVVERRVVRMNAGLPPSGFVSRRLSRPRPFSEKLDSRELSIRKVSAISRDHVFSEPYDGAWIKCGDLVDGLRDDYWYSGQVTLVTAHGYYTIAYPDGTSNVVEKEHIRRFQPYQVHERVEARVNAYGATGYVAGTVVDVSSDGQWYNVALENEEEIAQVHIHDVRRLPGEIAQAFVYQSAY